MSAGLKITWNGKSQTIAEWAKEAGLPPDILRHRLYRGMTFAEALTTPRRERRYREYSFNGRTQSLKAWSDELGIEISTLRYRLRAGYSVERAFTEQVHWGPIRNLALAQAIAKQEQTAVTVDPNVIGPLNGSSRGGLPPGSEASEAPGVPANFSHEAGDRRVQHRDSPAQIGVISE